MTEFSSFADAMNCRLKMVPRTYAPMRETPRTLANTSASTPNLKTIGTFAPRCGSSIFSTPAMPYWNHRPSWSFRSMTPKKLNRRMGCMAFESSFSEPSSSSSFF